MIVLVCGGRNYRNALRVMRKLTELHQTEPINLIIQGGARGADFLASHWAEANEIPCLRVPAKWSVFGKQAGHLRNRAMLEYKPDLVVAFPGGAGTRNMIETAQNCGVEVKEITE